MKAIQIASTLNEVINEVIGESVIVNEDLSNIVSIGQEVTATLSADGNFDNFVGKIIDKVGKVVIVDRAYKASGIDIFRDRWEYGSALEKIRVDLPEFSDNETWGLIKGQKYDDILVYEPPTVSAKIFNNKSTYQTKMSYSSEATVKEAFNNAESMMKFFAGIENRINTLIEVSRESLTQRAINNFIAQKIVNNNNVVNLLSMFNNGRTEKLEPADALENTDFLRFCAKQMILYRTYITKFSMLYNDDGYPTFTPKDKQKFVMLSMVATALETNLYSNTYHDNFVNVGDYATVPYWQASGTNSEIDFGSASAIDVTTEGTNTPVRVARTGIIGVLFDEEGVMCNNENFRVTSFYNPGNEATKYYYKIDEQYINDTAENCVVFTIDYTYTALDEEPADWATNYTDYFTYTDGGYVPVTGDSAPAWAAGKFYAKSL